MATAHPISPGDRFGKLVILAVESGADARVLARCDCGKETRPLRGNVVQGRTVSCGCHGRSGMHRTHGLSDTPTYIVWINMRRRCEDEKNSRYSSYGGRGIRVCDSWRSFEAFLADMGPRPDGMSLDRIDTNGHYEPENCQWATVTQQVRNRRVSARWVIGEEEFDSQKDAAAYLGVSQSRISQLANAGRGTVSRKPKY